MTSPLQSPLLQSAVILSPATIQAVGELQRYAPAQTPVLLVGATGTGKSFFAEALHELSGRYGSFTDVTAAELEGDVGLSQLFGHDKGAFTDAVRRRAGLIAEAGVGTLLLDDFHLFRRRAQAMLLRVLKRRRYRPVGADQDLRVGCRFVFGFGEDPDHLVSEGRLLPDVRYRLEHCTIRLPTLAERRDEIPALALRFLEQCPAVTGVDGPTRFASGAVELLKGASYPGNLRDLRGVVRVAYLTASAKSQPDIQVGDLPIGAQLSLTYDRRAPRSTQLGVVAWALWRTGNRVGRAAALIKAPRNRVAALRLELRRREAQGAGDKTFGIAAS